MRSWLKRIAVSRGIGPGQLAMLDRTNNGFEEIEGGTGDRFFC